MFLGRIQHDHVFTKSLLQLRILLFEFPQSAYLGLLNPAVPFAPFIECHVRDPVFAADLRHPYVAFFGLPQYRYNLFFPSALPCHCILLLEAILSFQLD